jgi:hypothetical protein
MIVERFSRAARLPVTPGPTPECQVLTAECHPATVLASPSLPLSLSPSLHVSLSPSLPLSLSLSLSPSLPQRERERER